MNDSEVQSEGGIGSSTIHLSQENLSKQHGCVAPFTGKLAAFAQVVEMEIASSALRGGG